MPELRVNIEDEWFTDLRVRVGGAKANQIVKDALALYSWAADQRARDRYIVSMDSKGEDAERLFMPSLEAAAPKTAEKAA